MDIDTQGNHFNVNSNQGTAPVSVPRSRNMEIDGSSDKWSLNFSTSPGNDCEMPFAKKPKTIRDPLSHRIIEKRRRDRMNNCLADLSRLIPTHYMKQGQGRIEKTEIIEMAIKHINYLTSIVNKHGALQSSLPDRYLGFKECQEEVMRYLVEVEEWDVHDQLCSNLMSHLEQAGEKFRIMNDESLSQADKEEQYRHIEDDSGGQQPLVLDPGTQMFETKRTPAPPEVPVLPVPAAPVASQSWHPAPSMPAEVTTQASHCTAPFVGLDSLASAQQITQEQLKNDKVLWTLLTSKYKKCTAREDSGLSTGASSCLSNNSSNRGLTCAANCAMNNDVYKVPDEPTSGLHAENMHLMNMEETLEKNEDGVYKFKHRITKRFSQEEKKMITNDSSSWSSGSLYNKCKAKQKQRHIKVRSPYSVLSANYPTSDSSNNNGSSSSSSNDQNVFLPGFVLHPNGTHYVPLSVHTADIVLDIFSKETNASLKVYHPISISVNFGGPLLHVKQITDLKTELAEANLGSTDSQVGISSVENLSGSNSDNSPNSEHETNK